jgi:hypothetical protein
MKRLAFLPVVACRGTRRGLKDMTNRLAFGLLAASLLLSGRAYAGPITGGPPAGALLDLNGTVISKVYVQYTTPSFTATSTTTDISFAFRDDPAFLFLDDVTMSNGAVVVNGGFEQGPVGATTPTGWTFSDLGAGNGGAVDNSNPHSGSNEYAGFGLGAYDSITQTITTVPGQSYTISFWLDENSGQSTYSSVSSGNLAGIDLLVYESAAPLSTPEPASLTLLGLGVASLAGYAWRRRR